MNVRFVLSPQAAVELVEIWHYISKHSTVAMADRIEAAIREKMAFLSEHSGVGHSRKDLTDLDVSFFPIYSYLIVNLPNTKPLQVASILHGRRDVEQVLKERL
jgi:plasmid stabilization system protein ParE